MALYRMTVTISDPSLGGEGVNTWHIRNTGDAPATLIELNGLSSLISTFYGTLANIYPSTTVVAFDGEFLQVDTDSPTVLSGDTWGIPGTGGTDPLPPANCIVVGWGTELAARSGRGRTFLGPIQSGLLQDNGTPSEEGRAEILGAANDLISASEALTNGAVGVYSPKDHVLRDFTSAKVANRFAVLRSRRD